MSIKQYNRKIKKIDEAIKLLLYVGNGERCGTIEWLEEQKQKLIDETLAAETTPPAIIDKLNNIQEQLFLLRKRETHDQPYLKYVEPTTKTKLRVNDWTESQPYYL